MAEPSFRIRRGVLADLDGIVANNIAMAKETEQLDLPLNTITEGVKAVLEGRASAWYYVLEEREASSSAAGHGEVVGQLMVGWIQSVYVLPRARCQGYFRQLYQHARAEAQAEKAGGLRLYADVHNKGAHAAYESLGMTSHYQVFEDMFTGY